MHVLVHATNVVELCRFLGMMTYLSKLSPNLSQKIKPLRDLFLSTKNEWPWLWEVSARCFTQIKEELSSTPVLALIRPK